MNDSKQDVYIKQVCETPLPQGPKCSQFYLDAFLENLANSYIGALPHVSPAPPPKKLRTFTVENFGSASVNGN